MLLDHWEVMVVIEMVVGEKDGWEVHKVERYSPGSERRPKMLNWNLLSFQLLEIIQVLDSTSWVCCASGNVCFLVSKYFWEKTRQFYDKSA